MADIDNDGYLDFLEFYSVYFLKQKEKFPSDYLKIL